MCINIMQHTFEGPYTDTSYLRNQPGIYVIMDNTNGKNVVVDVGESEQVRDRVVNHDRLPCWRANSGGTLCAAALYTPRLSQKARRDIEAKLRAAFQPACGVY